MIHTCTKDVINDLDRHGRLIRIFDPVDPELEMA